MAENLVVLGRYLSLGFMITIEVTIVSLTIGLAGGILLGVMRVYGGRLLSGFAAVYSMLIRATPLILVVLILYFVIAKAVNLPPFWAGCLSLGIGSSAYQSEIFRGAIQSIPGGQMMAARSIGMSRMKAIRYVILPQALRVAIAPWSNEAAIVLKDSSLVYVLGVPEILRQAQYYSARTYQPFLAFGAAALIYFCLTFLTNRGLDYFERKTRIPSVSS